MLAEIGWTLASGGVLLIGGYAVYRTAARIRQEPGRHRSQALALPAAPSAPERAADELPSAPIDIDLSTVEVPDPRPWWWYDTAGHKVLTPVPAQRVSMEDLSHDECE